MIPLLMPKSAGFSATFGANVMLMRLKPKRTSLTRLGPKMCVSFSVPIWRFDVRVSPKPGMVLPCRFGSARTSRW